MKNRNRLWILSRICEPDYDEVRAMVIRASSEAEARKIAGTAPNPGYEGTKTWTDPSRSLCQILNLDGSSGLIIRDFKAG